MRFDPVTPEFTLLKGQLLPRYGKNRHITPKISEYPGPIITTCTGLVGILVGMIIPIFVWRSPKGRCYGNQLNLGAVRRCRQERPLFFALAFDNEYDDREAVFKILNGNNLATLCTNLVNFCLAVSEFTLLKRAIFATTRPQFDDRSSFCTLTFRNELEDRNSDFRSVIGNPFYTSCRNLMRFGSVTPEFKL